jgi:2',3'-cyclic-nucleotide 2'-phosphodiesterase/3'-nucleotidase/5'-nucleotidase
LYITGPAFDVQRLGKMEGHKKVKSLMEINWYRFVGVVCILMGTLVPFVVIANDSRPDSLLRGLQGWQVMPIVTIGDFLPSDGIEKNKRRYQPVGSMDGLGAYMLDDQTVRVLINHELSRQAGYPYQLTNATSLKGSRVSFVDIDRKVRKVVNSGIAFQEMYDRQGQVVTQASQINQVNERMSGLSPLCSAQLVEGGQYGFVDTIFFTHEEVPDPIVHPHGGSLWALDVVSNSLHAVPGAGRMAWENTAALSIGGERVALLIGDDTAPQSQEPQAFGYAATVDTPLSQVVAAPLWLYVGKKNASFFEIRKALPSHLSVWSNHFLNRNGLFVGDLYFFVGADGKTTIDDFHGTGSVLSGMWKKIDVFDSAKAGQPGYDKWGYKDGFTLRQEAKASGAFQFSRPEDVSTHPRLGTRVVFSSTGRDTVFPNDAWGTIYQVDLNFEAMSVTLKILYDGDDAGGGQVPGPDFGIRSPDNLDWTDDGFIYVQEDRAKTLPPRFGGQSGAEASIWRLDARNGKIQRVAQINRTASLLKGSTDSRPDILGAWESSGIVDVTQLFDTKPSEKLFLATIQAHSVRDGLIADWNLVEGGQLVWLSHHGN